VKSPEVTVNYGEHPGKPDSERTELIRLKSTGLAANHDEHPGRAASERKGWQQIKMPDGEIVWVSYQGRLSSSSQLPNEGRFIGEEWSTDQTSWVWMVPAGSTFPSWVDP
jgi:hypothetical protein